MNIGIIGTEHIGDILAEFWARNGHQVMVSSRKPKKINSELYTNNLICKSGTIEQVAEFGDVVVLSTSAGQIDTIARLAGPFLKEKVIIDTMSPCVERDGAFACDIITRNIATGIATQELFPQSKVVRAFCNINYIDLKPTNGVKVNPIVIPYSSDHEEAKKTAVQLIYDAGYQPYFLGKLSESKALDPGGKIYGKALTETQLIDLLSYPNTRITLNYLRSCNNG